MTELEIDQSHLPRVQKVCQCFAVLEDGALAYNLQEQEIEQYYSSNVQKNQLVQRDVRVARSLQDEEERATLLSRGARQLEEQDLEYARMVQEEIRRCAEEARRREEEDEEMAKRMQKEEEEMDVRRKKRDSGCHGSVSGFPLSEDHPSMPDPPPPPQSAPAGLSFCPCPCPSQGEMCCQPLTTRGQHLACDKSITEPLSPVKQNNSVPQLGVGPTAVLRLIKNNFGKSRGPGESSEDESFLALPTIAAHRPGKRFNTTPCRLQGATSHMQGEENYRIRHCFREERGDGGREEGIVELGREGSHPSISGTDLRSVEVGNRADRGSHTHTQDRVRSWTYRESRGTGERHVRFQYEGRRYHGDRRRKSLGGSSDDSSGDQCVPARHDYHRGIAQGAGGLKVDHVQQGINGAAGWFMRRDTPAGHSYHGSVSNDRSHSKIGCRGKEGSPDGDRVRNREGLRNQGFGVSQRGDNSQDHGAHFLRTDCHRGGCIEQKGGGHGSRRNHRQELRCGHLRAGAEPEGGVSGRSYRGSCRARRHAIGRWHGSVEESSSKKEVQRREERQKHGLLWRSASISVQAAGAGLWQRGTCLELGALQQVLLDEELARRLQEEEEQFHRKNPHSPPSPHNSGPERDFRAAQVAQDEEIARFMQRQEMKSKRRSRDLEGQGSRSECGDSGDACERRVTREGKLQVQRERLDSERLPSPSEEISPEHVPPSPVSTAPQLQPIRNIAEELDPTFKARRKDGSPPAPISSVLCRTPPTPNRGFHDYADEPLFIPPTKRHSDKSGRGKDKEKKEGCKQQ